MVLKRLPVVCESVTENRFVYEIELVLWLSGNQSISIIIDIRCLWEKS